ERSRDLVGEQIDRRIEWRDCEYDADRQANRYSTRAVTAGPTVGRKDLAADPAGLRRRDLQRLRGPRDLNRRVPDGLAQFVRLQPGELVPALGEQRGRALQNFGSAVCGLTSYLASRSGRVPTGCDDFPIAAQRGQRNLKAAVRRNPPTHATGCVALPRPAHEGVREEGSPSIHLRCGQ